MKIRSFLCSLLFSSLAYANTLHIDNLIPCNDLNAGTASAPLCTVSAGTSKMAAGDTLLIHSGAYPIACSLSFPQGSIKAASGATPTLSLGLCAPTDKIPPSVPMNLKVTAPNCGMTLIQWDASTDTGGSELKGYNIYRKKVFLKQVAMTQTTDEGFAPGVYPYYSISAVDNDGNESAKSVTKGTYTQSCQGQGGNYRWSKGFGGSQVPDGGQSVALDSAGNIFVTGHFSSTMDLGGGPLVSVGYRDIYLAKYSSDGTHVWSKSFGGPYDDMGLKVTTDSQGNVYLAGVFLRSLNYGSGTYTSLGGYDTFLAKLSSSGSLLWSKQIGGAGNDTPSGLAIDHAGNLSMAGQFSGATDFGGGVIGAVNGPTKAYLAKYGPDGTYLWAKAFAGSFVAGKDVAVDLHDNLWMTGYAQGTMNFGGGNLTANGDLDVFLAKFSSSGTHLFSRLFGNSNAQHGLAIAVDANDNVFVTGDFMGSVNFGGESLLPSGNAQTIFLASFMPDGAHRWSKSFTVPLNYMTVGSYGRAITTDPTNHVILTGSLIGPVDLGAGALAVSGIFLAKFTNGGAHVWSKSYRSGGGDGRGVAIGSDGGMVLTGSYDTVVDLGAGEMRATGGFATDAFLLSIDP